MTTKEQNQNEIESVEIVGAVEHISEPRFYEFLYLIRPGLGETELRETENAIRTIISDLNGIIAEEKMAGARGLAFPLGKFNEANRGFIKFMLKPNEIAVFKMKLNKIKEIIRSRLTLTSKETRAPRRQMIKTTEERAEIKTEELDKKLEEILG